jgi:hypothetical protein
MKKAFDNKHTARGGFAIAEYGEGPEAGGLREIRCGPGRGTCA